MSSYAGRVCRVAALSAAACLSLIAGVRGTAAQEEALPGVRGRLYVSPSYGFGVAWEPEVWTATEATADRIETGPWETLTLDRDDAMITIEAWTAYDPWDEAEVAACVEDRLAGLREQPEFSGLEEVEPVSERPGALGYGLAARWRTVNAGADGATQSIDVGIECARMGTADAPVIHRETRFALDLNDGADWPSPFSSYGYHSVTGEGGPALRIEVMAADGGLIRLEAENLDIEPAALDLRQVAADTGSSQVAATAYRVDSSDAADEGGMFTLGPGDRLTVMLEFPVKPAEVAGFVYLVEGEAIQLTPCWGGCGPGLLPIIRIGE